MMGYGHGRVLGSFNGEMADFMKDMMWPYQTGPGRLFWGAHWVFELVTWVLIIVLLVALIRWVWKKGG